MAIQNKWRNGLLLVGMLALVTALAGCNSNKRTDSLTEIRTAYDAQNYAQAYQLGASASYGRGVVAQQAAYMAGMSAYKLGKYPEAINHLSQSSQSSDKSMAGDSLATMGLIFAQQNNHMRAARSFKAAAKLLEGQAKANAFFYAAVSEQKVGRWADARSHLSIARAESSDAAFKSQVDDQLAVTGYSLQVGAFAEMENARSAATRWSAKMREMRIGQPRLVPQTTADGQSVTAVQIGQFSSYATALMARQDLGDQTAIVVPLR